MNINPTAVKEHRLKRGWTQQHLADACEVNLRTVQRIENTGNAAAETVQSLCAALEINLSDLSPVPKENLSEYKRISPLHYKLQMYMVGAACFTMGLLTAIFIRNF